MFSEAETQYNPQCGVRRTIFSDEYDFLTKIESVCAKEDGIHFLVRTWKDRIATVRITFLTPSVFRFMMVPEMTAKSYRQAIVEDVAESDFETKNAEFTENEDMYIYETNQLSLHFSKNYWEMSIYQNGKLLTKEQAFDTNVDNRWKQLPTGFRVDASGKSIASFEQFVLFSDEQFWGFGEKFTHFNKRGQRIECWQKDALSTNTEDSYKSHPYFTSSRGYSVLLNTFTRSSFDMGASSWISYQMGSDDPILDYIFLAEESKDYKKLLQQYLQITGQIPMIPKWAFGFWMSKCSYMSRKEVEDVVADAEKFGIGIDVIHIDGWQRQDMSGVSFWGYDLGGFYNTGYIGNEERPNIEDYLSSVQMGLWMPLSRAHGKTPREPWQYGDMALKEVKKWINFRHRLVPYLYHTACQSHQSGIPMIRPLVMEYPKDPIAKTQNLSYMLGDALLISPGFDRDEYELYLPEGRWQDIESKEVLHVPAQLWKQEDLENCASHSRYFSDELDAQNFY